METFVWLGSGMTDVFGFGWPEPGEPAEGAKAMPGAHLLVAGVGDELWRAEFDGVPELGPVALEGTARLAEQERTWAPVLAGALRFQFFENARVTLARALAAVDSPEWPNALSRDVMLDAMQVGRKVALSRAPVELLQTLDAVRRIVTEFRPPEKKRGLRKAKIDTTRVYELMRKALEASIASAEEIAEAAQASDITGSVNAQIEAGSRMARADLMFSAMLRASAAANQEAMESLVRDAQDATEGILEIELPAGQAGLGGGVVDRFGLAIPEPVKVVTAWLGDRLDIDVTQVDFSRFARK